MTKQPSQLFTTPSGYLHQVMASPPHIWIVVSPKMEATILTKGLVKEYVTAIRTRYHKANKLEKKKILDEFVKATGYHRKAAIRLLHQESQLKGKPPGRPSHYSAILGSLLDIWEVNLARCCTIQRDKVISKYFCLKSLF